MSSETTHTSEEWMALTDAERRTHVKSMPDLTLDDLPEDMRRATVEAIEETRTAYGL